MSLITLGGEDCLIDYLELKSHMAHPGSLRRCCSRITLGRKFLRRIKQGTLQFVLVRPTTALLALVLSMFGLYDEENWGLDSGYIYLTLINNVSVTVSLYVLSDSRESHSNIYIIHHMYNHSLWDMSLTPNSSTFIIFHLHHIPMNNRYPKPCNNAC